MRGSLWNKWELHIHTPGTKLNDQFVDSQGKKYSNSIDDLIWKEYCQKLNESNIKCFGITDYFSVENFLKLRTNREAWGLNKDIILFPNIELRLTGLIASKSATKPHSHVNVHVIFPEDIDELKLLSFLSQIEVDGENGHALNFKDDISQLISNKGIPALPSVSTLKKALTKTFGKKYKDHCIIMIPNGDDGLAKTEGNGHRQNLNFMKEDVDIVQTISKKDRDFYLNNCKDIYEKLYPCVGGSDAHSFNRMVNYELEKSTWIKADTNFQGLKTILVEPEERVIVQANHPDIKLNSKIIDYIKLPSQEFGSKKVYFNSGINVIVGGRSSGKSLLMSLLAKKTGNAVKVKRNNDNYEKLIQQKALDTEVYLKDGSNSNGSTIIEFFYQDKLQEIASDNLKRNTFIKEIIGENENIKIIKDTINNKVKNLSDINVKLQNERQLKDGIIKKLDKIQTLKQLEQNIIEIESELKSLTLDSNFNNEEFKKINTDIHNIISVNYSNMNKLQSYKNIENIKFYVLNTNLSVQEEDLINEIHDTFTSRIKSINSEIEEYISGKMKIINEDIKNNIKIKEQLENSELYLAYTKKLESAPRLEVLNKQKEELKTRERLVADLNGSNDRLEKLINDITNIIDFKNLLGSQRVLDKESVKLSINVSFNKDKIYDTFQSIFKINYTNFKDLASGKFKEIATWKEENKIDFDDIAKDFEITVENILNSNNMDVYKSGKDEFTFISLLSEFNYINQDYQILYKDKDFITMSEGKKAFVLLLLKLEIGEDSCPLLIDQPEDDLDNRAIVKELVTYFKKQKKKRQLFIVTHNANIVVAADSENIIIANEHDSENSNPDEVKYFYRNGSLENEEIRKMVCEILEGGKDAFKQRESRYNF